ncbi:G-D-S-L family lipolytic protein [Elizabethkingia anophelis]|nr:G-D-S-L family lipolytic protein [Elizabethkingia anophelis]MDV4090881.1 G-D-S-L family lipolytic protein [Elizabethkingia anophelis]
MKKYILTSLSVASFLALSSCKTDFDQNVSSIKPTNGDADFSNYVSLGNSLTSGFRDNALYLDGQKESYPSIIAAQMKLAGGGEFKQPLMPNNTGGFTDLKDDKGNIIYPGKLNLQVVSGTLSPIPSAPAAALDNITSGGPYNNMGVPGAKSYHLLADSYGNADFAKAGKANPYFARFASSSSTSVIKDAVAKKPTFFSLWIGNNDVLSYATSGGAGKDQKGNINPATYGSNDISDPQVVAGSIEQVVLALKAAGTTKGILANIPDVSTIPFFTTVPAMPITGLTADQVAALNSAQAYGKYNAGLATAKGAGLLSDAEYQQRLIKFTAGATINGAVIVDKDLTNLSALGLPSYRQTTAKDMIILPASTLLKSGSGTQTALEDQYVLTEKEAAKVATAVTAYNPAIAAIAQKYGLAFVDANAKMKELSSQSGIQYNGVKYTATFVTGGAFSLDGVHLTGRGYAVIANEFIKAINKTYKSTLTQVNPNDYSGVKFP